MRRSLLYASGSHLKAMVLAAGVGARLDPLTAQLPKPLVPIVNKPVMEHIFCLLRNHGFNQIAINLHHLPELIQNHFGDGSAFDIKLNYLLEKNLSGDAGGVRGCRHYLEGDTFLVIMGDLLTNADLSYLLAEHKKKGALATIALKKVENVSQLGVVLQDESGWITEFQEKPAPHEARSDLASTGIYILEPAIFNFIPKDGICGFGKQLFPQLVKQGQSILGVQIEDYWSDVGTLDQYRQANFDVLNGKISFVYGKAIMLR
jgi:mannose-1-phosphate guanylyltransferase/mannose-1-phosphate guanylyltransferase/phosphomannomutase